jgi:RimJ/RimL family protein N-acetyltransferase
MHIIYKLPVTEFFRYRAHLLSLDEESRYMRFGFYIKNDVINQLCDKWALDPANHKIFAIEDSNMEIIAVGHISLEGETPELAFSVFKEHQGKGMGSALMKRCIEYCQNKGIKDGYMVCLPANDKIKKLARKHGVLLHTEDGECEGDITIPGPTPVSVWHEYVEDSIGKLDHLGKAQRKIAQMFRFPLLF